MFGSRKRLLTTLTLSLATLGCPPLRSAGASDDYVIGSTCDPANAEDIADVFERALLDTIAYTEGTRGHGKDGYNVTYAYHYFDSCEDHPNLKVCAGKYCSTAAGRYQFLFKTYQGLNLPGFWPEDQERGALELIDRRGVTLPATAPLTATQFANALDKLSYEWASLPPGRYGQPQHSIDQIRTEYCLLAGCDLKYPPPPEPEPSVDDDSPFLAAEYDGMLYSLSNPGDVYEGEGEGEFQQLALEAGSSLRAR
jgi:muramidase (phage lysozyme)